MKATVRQILDLYIEIKGLKTEESSFPGLINERLTIKTKFWLQKLLKKVVEERNNYIEQERNLFISLGAIEENGELVIKEKLEDGSDNPNFKEVNEQRSKLLTEEIDLGNFNFDINDFDCESESKKHNYYTFMSVAFD